MHQSNDLVISSNPYCSPRDASQHFAKPILKLTKKITRLKSQESLLKEHVDLDLFSSIRLSVGKKFVNPVYEKEIDKILKEARMKVVEIQKKPKMNCVIVMKLQRNYLNMSSENYAKELTE